MTSQPAWHWLLAAAAGALLATPCIGLALREEESRKFERAIGVHDLNSMRAPPIEVESVRSPVSAYRRVMVRGSYDHAHEVLIRGAVHQDEPGFHVVTPLRVKDGAFLVLRGWIPQALGDAAQLVALREAGEVAVEGIPLPAREAAEGGTPDTGLEGGWPLRVDTLDVAELKSRLPYPLFPFVVQQLPRIDLPKSPLRLLAPRPEAASRERRVIALYIAAAALAGLPFASLLMLRMRT